MYRIYTDSGKIYETLLFFHCETLRIAVVLSYALIVFIECIQLVSGDLLKWLRQWRLKSSPADWNIQLTQTRIDFSGGVITLC